MQLDRFLVVLLFFMQILLTAAADEPQKQPALTVSVETTRITKPLDQNGLVDYVRAVDVMNSKGVTTDNNFEVVMRRVVGPKAVPEEIRERYHQELGIAIPGGPFFERLAHDGCALSGPGMAKDLSNVAEWLGQQKEQLEAIAEGSRRPRNYTPYIADATTDQERDAPRMSAIDLTTVQDRRVVALGLVARAHLRIGEGELAAAWEDGQAILRLSRLTSPAIIA